MPSELISAFNTQKQPGQSLQDFQKTFTPTNTAPPPAGGTAPAPITPSAPSAAPTMTADPAKEQAAMQKLGISNIQAMQMGENPAFRKQLLEMAYGSGVSQIPEYQQLQAAEDRRTGLGSELEGFEGNTGNMMMALEEGLRAKGKVGDIQVESELFQKAGLGGYENIVQSLNQGTTEMNQKYDSFINQLDKMGSFKRNQYSVLADQYKTLTDEYQGQQEQMNNTLNQIQSYNEAIGLSEQQFDVWKRQQEFARNQQPDANEIAEWTEKGYSYIGGEYIPSNSLEAIFGEVGVEGDKYIGECGYFSNRATNADDLGKHVGDSWESKIKTADNTWRREEGGNVQANEFFGPEGWNLEAGNTLFIPAGPYGHTAVVTGYDPVSGNISVIERNKGLDGQTKTGIYNVEDLQAQYPEFGVAKTSFTSDIQSKLGGLQGEEPSDVGEQSAFQRYYDQAKADNMNEDEARKRAIKQIEQETGNLTETQSKSFTAYATMKTDGDLYDELFNGVGDKEEFANNLNVFTNQIKTYGLTGEAVNRTMDKLGLDDENIRRLLMAEMRWTEAYGRKMSGAAIKPEEYDSWATMFFPRAGGDEKSMQDKLNARRVAEVSMYEGMGSSGQRSYKEAFEDVGDQGSQADTSFDQEDIDFYNSF